MGMVWNLDHRTQVVTTGLHKWWQAFHYRWRHCKLCSLCKGREKVVHFRGIIPAKILFVGEAPGESEDEVGRPFVGPAGRLLDQLIEQAGIEDGDYCIINTVACFPHENREIRPPTKEEIRACAPRLEELMDHIKPQVVILLGSVSAAAVDPFLLEGVVVQRLVHPSFLKRTGERPIDIKRFVLTLKRTIELIPQ